MNKNNQLCVKIFHCGNKNITNPNDNLEKFVFYMPMGIFSLASILVKNGIDAEIIHLDLESNKTIEEILDFNTVDAVGFACHWANQSRGVVDMAALIKQWNPNIFIFLGGYTASFFAREIIEEFPAVDAVIRGDAEIPIVQLCKTLQDYLLKAGTPISYPSVVSFEGVQNLTWRGMNNEVFTNELSYVSTAEELNQFDFAAVDLLRNWERYLKISKYWTKFKPINTQPMFLVEVGRGCKFNCSYCGGNAYAQTCLSRRDGQFRRSIDSIIASIKKGISFGYRCFFVCFEFDGSDEWYTKLFRRIKEEKLNVSFAYESWSLPSKVLVDVMSECCDRVMYTISPDNGDPEIRMKNKDKRLFYTNEDLEACLAHIATKENVNVQVYFGYFLPYETEETIYKTMNFITTLFLKYSHFTEIVYMGFDTDPCSSLFLKPQDYDFHVSVHHFRDFVRKIKINFEMKDGKVPGMTLWSRPRTMTEREAVNLANKINLFNNLFYFRDSILELFKRINDTTIFSDYFRTIDLSFAGKDDISIGKVKQVLLAICREHNVLDAQMSTIISREYAYIRSLSLINNLTHFYITETSEIEGTQIEEGEGEKQIFLMENKLQHEEGDFGF